MADLPDNAPRMFQLPTATSVPWHGNSAETVQNAINSGANIYNQRVQANQGQQQLNINQQQADQQKALIQSQIQQQQIGQVDSLLKTGLSYPGLLPSFWPTIATKMNQISPDYKLDPKNPPENITTFAKQLSDISDGVQDKVVTPPQAHSAVTQLIGDTFPNVHEALGSNAQVQGPPQTPVPGGMGAQPVPNGQIPSQTPSAPDPLADFATLKAQYDKANSYIASTPPGGQEELRKQLESSSLGVNYKKSLDQLATHANAVYGAGQEKDRMMFAQKQDNLRSAASTFPSQSQEFKNVSDNFSAFNHLMDMSSQMEKQGSDTTARVQAEKTALLNFAQMAYPGTGRPGNPEMLETMEKSGPAGTLISQTLNRLDKGDVMTPSQIKGLRQTAVALYAGREATHSQLEQGYAQNIQANGGNPGQFLRDIRPQGAISTSKIFPKQSSDKAPAIGHVMKTKTGDYQYLGGNMGNPENWVKLGEDSE